MRRVVVFACWTLFVWGTRLRLAWVDSSESTGERVYSTVWAALLVAGALALLVACARSRRRGLSDRADVLVFAMYVLTVLVWLVRIPGIVHHGGAGFVVVHLTLGVISVLLGRAASHWANPEMRRDAREPSLRT